MKIGAMAEKERSSPPHDGGSEAAPGLARKPSGPGDGAQFGGG